MATTTNFGWETPDDTDLVKDGAAAMRTLGNSIDTSLVDLKGGTTGQILSKASNTDMDFTWITNDVGDITAVTAGTGITGGGTSGAVTITNDMATKIDAKGDLIVGTAADTYDRLAVGATNGHVLTVDSSASTGMKWAAAAAGAGNMAQIATGTLSGASVTISSLSNYDDLVLAIYQTTNNTADGIPKLRINNNSGANYNQFGTYHDATSFQAYSVTGNDAILLSSNNVGRTVNANVFVIKLTNCKQAGFTDWDCFTRMYDGNNKAYFHKGIYAVSEAVSSLVILNTGGTWSAGTYTLWGA